MKRALIQGTRICDIVDPGNEFPVASGLDWVDVADDTTQQDTYEDNAVVKFQTPTPTILEIWETEMSQLDNAVTPRMVEDIYEFVINGTPVPQEVADVMAARQTKRGQRP